MHLACLCAGSLAQGGGMAQGGGLAGQRRSMASNALSGWHSGGSQAAAPQVAGAQQVSFALCGQACTFTFAILPAHVCRLGNLPQDCTPVTVRPLY